MERSVYPLSFRFLPNRDFLMNWSCFIIFAISKGAAMVLASIPIRNFVHKYFTIRFPPSEVTNGSSKKPLTAKTMAEAAEDIYHRERRAKRRVR